MKKGKLSIVSLIAVMLFSMAFFQPRAYAALTKLLSYQGRLLDGSGTPVPNGTYSFTFSLYNVSSGGSALWTETQNLNVENGGYSAYLGSVNPLTISFTEDYWLGIKVASDPEMTPRLRMAMVGNAIFALDSEKLGGQTAGSYSLTTHTHTGLPASNADTVDNFHASATPTASTLLPLDSSAKFPASVLPSITSSEISDGTIVNADISSSAAIADTKLATISSSGKVADSALSGTNWSTLTGGGNTTLHTHNSLPSGATIGSANVCLQNGTNCPVAGGSVALSPSATQTIQPTADVVPLIIKDDAGTTANLFDIQNNAGTSLLKVNPSGNLLVGNPTLTTAKVSVEETGATGYGGYFKINNASNNYEAVQADTYSATGRAGLFRVLDATNTSPALEGYTSGTGSGVMGVSNGGNGVQGTDNGSGIGVEGWSGSTGTGIAGFFKIWNAANTSSIIQGDTAGTGNLLKLQKNYADRFVVSNDGKVTFATGTNKPVGTGTVTGGTNCATVSNTLVTTGSMIILTIETTNTSIAALKIKSKTAGASFSVCTLDETNAAQNIAFNYLIVN